MANVLKRKRALSNRNDPAPSKTPPPKPNSRYHGSRFFPKFGKRRVSLNHAPDAARPKSEHSNHPRSGEDQASTHPVDTLTRSSSAPILVTLGNDYPPMDSSQDVKHVSFDATLRDEKSVPNDDNLPAVNGLNVHDDTPDCSPSVLEDPLTEQALVPQTHADEGPDNQLDATDSGSAPTQFIDFSDGLSYRSGDASDKVSHLAGPTMVNTLSQILEYLRDLYGLSYQQTDDIAGIDVSQSTERIAQYLSPHEMSVELNEMSVHFVDKTDRVLRVSITPWLPVPLSYSETLREASSSSDEETGLTRSYVSSWIFMSLAMSRIDGLRYIFTIYLSFWICGADASSLSVAQAATATEQKWFKDGSNIDPEDKTPEKTILPNECSSGFRTKPNSTNSSKVAAVSSGSDSIRSPNAISKHINTPAKATTLGMPYQMNDQTSDEESVEESTDDDETELPPSRVETKLNAQQKMSLDLQEDSNLGNADISEPELDNVPDNKEGQTIEESLPNSQSDTCVSQAWSRSSSPGGIFDSETNTPKSKRDEDLLPCEDPDCERTFVNKSELMIHVELRHHDVDYPRRSFASPRSRFGLLTPEESDFSADERSRAYERRKKERSLPLRPARRQPLPLGRRFRIRSGKEAEEFFVRGRVFAVVWHDNSSPWSSIVLDPSGSSSPNLSIGSYGELVYSQIKLFVVAKTRQGYCLALPIYNLDDEGPNRKNLPEAEGRRHAIIYDSRSSSTRSPDESHFTKESIPVDVVPGETLDASSRLTFDMPQTFRWDTKVKDIGMVKGEQNVRNLMLYLRTELQRGEEEEPIAQDKDGEQRGNVDPEQDSSITSSEMPPNPSSPGIIDVVEFVWTKPLKS